MITILNSSASLSAQPKFSEKFERVLAPASIETPALTIERLKSLLEYNPETGEFRWLVTKAKARAGSLAGVLNKKLGYLLIGIDGKRYYGGRLAYFYMMGNWPAPQVDYIDGDTSNIKWKNLRSAVPRENSANAKIHKDNLSGAKGVSWRDSRKRWRARVMRAGKTHAREFKRRDKAIAFVRAKRAELHGEYARHG
jgi:hypothetical protein